MRRLTNEEVICKLKELYGDKFIYSEVDYVNSRSPITLVCPIHGSFSVYANNALQGRAVCVKCESKTPTLEEFIKKSSEAHNNKYDYSNTNYVNLSTRATVNCPIHGEFSVLPKDHIKGLNGCPLCKKEASIKKAQEQRDLWRKNRDKRLKERTEIWKKECSRIHRNKYNYDNISIIKYMSDKVPIQCPKHGIFYQSPSSHLLYGCKQCATEFTTEVNRYTQEEFEGLARKIHGDTYKYGLYKGMFHKMEIYCPEHGMFLQDPKNHLHGCGCPYCSSSSGETYIKFILDDLDVIYKQQYKIEGKYFSNKVSFVLLDFVVKYKESYYVIEYNGIQHYEYVKFFHPTEEDFKNQIERDNLVKSFCEAHKFNLIVFKYSDNFEDIKNKLYEIFKENKEITGENPVLGEAR